MYGGDEVNEEREDVEGEDEGNGPFEDGGCIVRMSEVGCCKSNGQSYFDQDECELDPE